MDPLGFRKICFHHGVYVSIDRYNPYVVDEFGELRESDYNLVSLHVNDQFESTHAAREFWDPSRPADVLPSLI